MAAEEEDWPLWQELQVLQSIYLEELDVTQEDGVLLRITLYPTTGDDMECQYVCLTLQLALPPQYPDRPPEISVSNPRGLCDEQIHSILETLRRMAAEAMGSPVLYELIEKGKEMLTASNIPRGHCVICLYGFQEGDSLTKTPCYHHFHSHCLGRYARHCQEPRPETTEASVLCPVCRECLTCDLNKLLDAPPPQQTEEWYVPDACALQREEELQRLYARQKANGGIIDVEAERNRFFISIQETPAIELPMASSEESFQSVQEDGLASGEESSLPLLTSKPQHIPSTDTERHQARARPVSRGRHDGHHWRESRGGGGRARWRDETGHRSFQARGRGKTRSYHPNGTVRSSMHGPPENSQTQRNGS